MTGARALRMRRGRRSARVPRLAPPIPVRFVSSGSIPTMAAPVVVISLDVAASAGVAIALVDALDDSVPRTAYLRVLSTIDADAVSRRRLVLGGVSAMLHEADAVCAVPCAVLVVCEQWTLGGLERAPILSMGTSKGRWREAIALLVPEVATWCEVHVEDWRAYWLGRAKVSTETGKALALERLAMLRSTTGEAIYADRDHNAAEALGMLTWSVAYGVGRLIDESKGNQGRGRVSRCVRSGAT